MLPPETNCSFTWPRFGYTALLFRKIFIWERQCYILKPLFQMYIPMTLKLSDISWKQNWGILSLYCFYYWQKKWQIHWEYYSAVGYSVVVCDRKFGWVLSQHYYHRKWAVDYLVITSYIVQLMFNEFSLETNRKDFASKGCLLLLLCD